MLEFQKLGELTMVSRYLPFDPVFCLLFQAKQQQFVQLNELPQLDHFCFLMGLFLPQIVFLIIDVVKVTAAVHLHRLHEYLELLKAGHPSNTKDVSHDQYTSLHLA